MKVAACFGTPGAGATTAVERMLQAQKARPWHEAVSVYRRLGSARLGENGRPIFAGSVEVLTACTVTCSSPVCRRLTSHQSPIGFSAQWKATGATRS